MAVNPITSEELTINFADLLKIPVSSRVQAAMMSPQYANALMQALTPVQMAKAFPDYYRRELPDISNFILANRYLDDKGATAFTQKGGGDYGEDMSSYDGTKVPPPPKTVVDKILEGAKLHETVDGVEKRDAGGPGELGFTQDTTLDPRKRALLDAIATDSGGGYGTINYVGARQTGISQTNDFSKHPFEGEKGYTASGRYQILATNYEKFAKKLGLYDYEKKTSDFSPEAQDKIAYEMAKDVYRVGTGGRNLDEDIQNNNISPEQLIKPLSIDYGWHILKTEGGMQNAVNVFRQNEPAYIQDVKIAEEKAKLKPQEPITITKEVADILNSDPMTKKYFMEDKPEMGQRLQEQINAGVLDINSLKGIVDSSASKIRELIQTTEQMKSIGGDAIVNEGQTRVSEQQEVLAGTRKLPLQEDLTSLMDYAGQKISEESGKNIYMKVFSGGQAAIGTAGPRTGSTEHDLGGAADVYFIERLPDGTERTLSMTNPEDKKLMYQAAYHFSRAGGRSVGLESGYMGDQAMHLGISRNNEDPVHHGDPELQAIVDQGKNEFLTEARNSGWDMRYGYKNFIEKERAERVAAYEEQNKAKLAAEQKFPSQKTVTESTDNVIKSDSATSTALTETKEQNKTESSVAAVPEVAPVPTFQYGGSPETQDDENLSVYDDSGSLRFKMNSGEGIYVKPESEEYADTKIEELSGRLDEMSDRFDSQSPASTQTQQTRPSMPKTEQRNNWSQKVVAADRPRSPSADRANRRTKFLNEGWRAGGRGSPNSITS